MHAEGCYRIKCRKKKETKGGREREDFTRSTQKTKEKPEEAGSLSARVPRQKKAEEESEPPSLT